MTSFVKFLLSVILLFLVPSFVNGKDIACYKLTETTKPNIKIGAIQFISFIGDQCYESDINGISVQNGIMRRNEYQSNHNTSVYNGTCFCGSQAKFVFTKDMSTLRVTSKNGEKFIFKRVTPPTGVTTSSLIRAHSSDFQNFEDYNSITPNSYYQPQQNFQNGNNNSTHNHQAPTNQTTPQRKRKCVYCNGTGQITKDDSAPASYGIKRPNQQCPVCGKWYDPNVFLHYHQSCYHCGSTGYAK